MLTFLKGWRTVAINAFFGAAGVLEAIDPEALRPYLPENKMWIVGAVAITNIVLRALTTGPVGTKQ